MQLRQDQENAERDSERKSEAIEQSLTILLRKLAEECGLAGNSDRVSVYYHHDGQFIMPARWSLHPEYTKARRRAYSLTQGAIGTAWDEGFVVTQLPNTRVRWEKRLVSNHGFTEGEASQIGMMCQSIGGLRIMHDNVAVGVLIFESLAPTRVTAATLEKAQSSMLYAMLSELIAGQAVLTPRVEAVVREAAKVRGAQPWKSV